ESGRAPRPPRLPAVRPRRGVLRRRHRAPPERGRAPARLRAARPFARALRRLHQEVLPLPALAGQNSLSFFIASRMCGTYSVAKSSPVVSLARTVRVLADQIIFWLCTSKIDVSAVTVFVATSIDAAATEA